MSMNAGVSALYGIGYVDLVRVCCCLFLWGVKVEHMHVNRHDIADVSSLTTLALAQNRSTMLYIWQHIGCCAQARILANQAAHH